MIVKTMDDVRDAFDRMAKHNRVSLTALNDLAGAGSGILTRLRRKDVPARGGKTGQLSEADIKMSTALRVIQAAGWELVLQPAVRGNRRQQVLDAVRNTGGKDVVAEEE